MMIYRRTCAEKIGNSNVTCGARATRRIYLTAQGQQLKLRWSIDTITQKGRPSRLRFRSTGPFCDRFIGHSVEANDRRSEVTAIGDRAVDCSFRWCWTRSSLCALRRNAALRTR